MTSVSPNPVGPPPLILFRPKPEAGLSPKCTGINLPPSATSTRRSTRGETGSADSAVSV